MILRRLTANIKAQNWFAVVLDFVIVVVGVFVGLQVSNWNDVKKEEMSRGYYLERLASDLSQTIAFSEDSVSSATETMGIIERFTAALNDPTTPPDELVNVTRAYFGEGTLMTGFGVIWGTYEDMSSTGNFSVLESPELVASLIRLNTYFEYLRDSAQVNTDWVMPFESSLATAFDWMRYDDKTAKLFPVLSPEEQAVMIRENADLLRRHAALHYWVSEYAVSSNESIRSSSQQVLDMVQAEIEGAK